MTTEISQDNSGAEETQNQSKKIIITPEGLKGAIKAINDELSKPIYSKSISKRVKTAAKKPRSTLERIKTLKAKEAIKAGKTLKSACIDAGYSIKTAESHPNRTQAVKIAVKELEEELTASKVGVDYLIKRTNDIISKAEAKEDLSNAHRGLENIGKWTQIEKPSQNIVNIWDIDADNAKDLDKLTQLARKRGSLQVSR